MNLILRQVLGYQQGKRATPAIAPSQELTQTKQQLHSILNKWEWGGVKPQTSQEFLNKFEPWINTQLEEQKNLKLFLAKKGVNNLTEAETKLTNQDLSEHEELNQLREELAQTKELWKNTEEDYLRRIEELSKERPESEEITELRKELADLKEQLETYSKGEDWETQTGKIITDLEQEVKDLTTERDEALREQKTAEQEILAKQNQLRNKNKEVDSKDKEIQLLKKEKSSSEIALNKTITELKKDQEKLKKKYSKQGQLLDGEQCENNKLTEKIEELERKLKEK